MNQTKGKHKIIGVTVLIIAGTIGAALIAFALLVSSTATRSPFDINETGDLSPLQQRVVSLLKQEYAAQPAGTKYTEGANEPWCADFASWIMREAGVAYTGGPDSDWRLELVEPITQYYKDSGRFRTAADGYQPKVGDVAMYRLPSPYGNHINIVIKNDAGLITAVGGNEGGEIQISTFRPADDPHFVGYGLLPSS